MVTQNRLRELFDYDAATGIFTRRVSPTRSVRVGDVAGTTGRDGYRRIGVDGRKYLAHRLAWLYVHGVMPDKDIDHINRNTQDNRISNLRSATESENKRNSPRYKNNKSGFKGVSFYRKTRKWVAFIRVNGKLIHLGYHHTPEAAHDAYCKAANALHGEFARTA